MRVEFKAKYGDTKLRYKLFEDSPRDTLTISYCVLAVQIPGPFVLGNSVLGVQVGILTMAPTCATSTCGMFSVKWAFMHPMDAMFTYTSMASTGEYTTYPSEEVSTPTLLPRRFQGRLGYN